MSTRETTLSTAEARRRVVLDRAVVEFARGGFHGTTFATIATAAEISPSYVFKLFPSKESLFAAALEDCFSQIITALDRGAGVAADRDPDSVLFAMGGAYADLIREKTLLLIQVHAQSVADIPEIGDALRAGIERVTTFTKSRSGASDDAVQRFMAYGQLCHLIVTAHIDTAVGDWASLLTRNIRHPD